MKKQALLVVIMFFLFGCTSTKQARLYPVNDKAAETGTLQVKYVDSGAGGGEASIIMPDGEILNGEYSTVDNSTVGFGSIYTSVNVAGGAAFGSGSSFSVPGSSPGIASFYGTNGTMMQCEYFVSRSGNAGGACKSEDGALYRLHF